MQATYHTVIRNGNTIINKGNNMHMKRKDTMERSEKRSPYDNFERENNKPGRRPPKRGAGFAVLTVLLLLFLFPIGIFFLWSRKNRMSVGTKIFVMLITGILFTGLMILAINYDTGNPRISEIQKNARSILEKVDGYTGNMLGKVGQWGKTELEEAREKGERLYELTDEVIAKEALEYYSKIDDNLYAVKVKLPKLLLEKFKALIDYVPEESKTNIPVMLATPDMGGLNVEWANQATDKEAEKETAVQTTPEQPEKTPVPTEKAPEITAQPTPSPTPTPKPIVLPPIKDVALAEVFFTPNGIYYHGKSNCSGMMNAVSHTLKEAQAANKSYCDSCGVVAFGMMECENYLWVDTKNRAHTTDECAQFAPGAYRVLPFDDVYNGSYNYCTECKSDICHEYMLQNDLRYVQDDEILDEDRIALYEYEKSITVYYGANSRNYHANAECMHMTGDKYIHTLYQALHVDMKQVCELCKPMTENDAYENMQTEK